MHKGHLLKNKTKQHQEIKAYHFDALKQKKVSPYTSFLEGEGQRHSLGHTTGCSGLIPGPVVKCDSGVWSSVCSVWDFLIQVPVAFLIITTYTPKIYCTSFKSEKELNTRQKKKFFLGGKKSSPLHSLYPNKMVAYWSADFKTLISLL